MTEEKEKIWEEATRKSYAENPMGTNWDRISIAMDLYAESKTKESVPESKKEQSIGDIATDFEMKLYELVNSYINLGLKKSDLVAKMEYVTESCRIS